jgi:hypothetical protein
MAKVLDGGHGLFPYIASTTLRTVSQHPDLMTRLALLKENDEWKKFKPLYEEAERRGGKREASEGTNIHTVVEAIFNGYDISQVPEPARSDGQAVWDAIHDAGYVVLAVEVFVATVGVLPEPCAGTLDLLLLDPSTGTIFVGDTKSVAEPKDVKYSATKWAIQTGIYANGQPYLEPFVRDQWGRPVIETDNIQEWSKPLDKRASLVIEVVRGQAKVRLHWIDTIKGIEIARAACVARNAKRLGERAVLGGAPW